MEDIKEVISLDDYALAGTPTILNDENYFALGNHTQRDFDFTFNFGNPFALEGIETPGASLSSIFAAQKDWTTEPNALWKTSKSSGHIDVDRIKAPCHDLNALNEAPTGVHILNAAPSAMALPVISNLDCVMKPRQEPSSLTKATCNHQQSSTSPSSNEIDTRSSHEKRNTTGEDGTNDAAPPKKRQRRARKKGPEPTKEEFERKKRASLERNRQAASRCRRKKKVKHCTLEETARQMKHERDFNQSIMDRLLEERESIREMLVAHADCPEIRHGLEGQERNFNRSIVDQLLQERERLREMLAAHTDCPEIRHWLEGQDLSLANNNVPPLAVDSPHVISPLTLIDSALQSENSPDERGTRLQSIPPVAMLSPNSTISTHSSRHAIPMGRHNSARNKSVTARHNTVHKPNDSMPSMLQVAMNLPPYPIPESTAMR